MVEKTRSNGTMSEAAFWGMIRSALRQRSRFWKPIQIARFRARRKYNGINKRQKFEYKCARCGCWFADKEVEVHHIKPVGTLRCKDDLPNFVENLFCEADELMVVCSQCHTIITNTKNE